MNTTLMLIFCGTAGLLFALQSILWTSMRLKKLGVEKWTAYARRIRIVSLLILATGGLLFALESDQVSAGWAVFGGGFNALIATLHLLTIAYLSGGKTGGIIDRKNRRRNDRTK